MLLSEMSDPADRRAVPEKPFSDAGFFFPVWPFAAGAKEQRRSEGIKGRRQKVFDAPAKSFWRRAFHPFLPEPAVLRPALRARAGRNAGKRQKGSFRPPRGLTLKSRRQAGTVNATAQPSAAVDPGHQPETARGRNPQGFGGAWRLCRLAT